MNFVAEPRGFDSLSNGYLCVFIIVSLIVIIIIAKSRNGD